LNIFPFSRAVEPEPEACLVPTDVIIDGERLMIDEAGEAAGAYGDIPADIVADVRGLPPSRASLARFQVWQKQVADDVARLKAGRDNLKAALSRAEEATARHERLIERDAASLADKIREGAAWALSSFGGGEISDLAVRLDSSKHQAQIAKAALAAIEPELATRLALARGLAVRHDEFMGDALEEQAEATIRAEYDAAVAALARAVAKARGLSAGDKGAFAFSIPGLMFQRGWLAKEYRVQISADEITAAAKLWRKLRDAWAKDPRAPVADYLKFK
jgi:hypothetical protein